MIQLDDAPDRDDGWQREEQTSTRSDWIHLALRKGGGCILELNPSE